MAKKEEKKDILDNAEALQEKVVSAEHWVEENPKIVIGVVVVLLLAAGAYFGGRYWIDTRDQEAQTEMFQ
ncbi:MAG: hypothetical protein ACK5XL_00155, partial [Cyclobacteriaceae bacterium]